MNIDSIILSIVNSPNTDNEQDNLQCWKWSGEVWQTFAMETENDVHIWISATQVSDEGIKTFISQINAAAK